MIIELTKDGKEMVKIVYEPYHTVIIHDIAQYSLNMLIHLHGLGVQSGQLGRPISWANGIAFDQHPMAATEDIIKEQIKGKIHWANLSFAFMPKHQRMIEIPDGKIRIPILNLSGNEIFRDVADWIKQHYKPT